MSSAICGLLVHDGLHTVARSCLPAQAYSQRGSFQQQQERKHQGTSIFQISICIMLYPIVSYYALLAKASLMRKPISQCGMASAKGENTQWHE